MKHQQFSGPPSGKLVFQLLRGITFAYDLHLGCSRDCWKGITEKYNSGMDWFVVKPKKCHLVPQNGPRSLGPEKSWKNSQTEITVFELVE